MKETRGIRNHNPGNIDRQPGVRWQGMTEDQSGDSRFVVFSDARWGIRAIVRVLITYMTSRQARDGSKIDTIRDVIDRWAPPTENHTGAYARHVAELTGIGIDTPIQPDYPTLRKLALAIITHENGVQPYSDDVMDDALSLAGVTPPREVRI